MEKNYMATWGIFNTFIKWRRILAFVFVAAVFITYVIALFLPKYYSSSALLFPPEKDSGSMGLASSLLGGGLGSLISGSGMSLPSFATLSDVYASVLQSRIVAENVIKENDLQEVYDKRSMELAVIELSGHLNVAIEPNGMIRVNVEDKDPERAVRLVNSFVDELNRINQNVRVDKARATRQFIESRLLQTKVDLKNAEEDYKNFQQKHKTISLDSQVNAMISNVAELKSKLLMSEIELGVFSNTLQPTHTKVLQKKVEIEEIKKQLEILENGNGDSGDDNFLSIPFSEAPDLGLELARLTRELKIQETIFELLTQQYEQAKIGEKRDTPTIQVLDPPRVPERRSRPKRLVMSLVAGILALMMTTVAIFAKEFLDIQKKENSEAYKQLEKAMNSVKDDFYAFRSLFASRKGGSGGQTS